MKEIVGIRFRQGGRIFQFDPADCPCEIGTPVIVDTEYGLDYGVVAFAPRLLPDEMVHQPLREVVRLADDQDQKIHEKMLAQELQALEITRAKIADHGLQMDLKSVHFISGENKLICYFMTDTRIDFRELVKDLASYFHMRIEMRQLSSREEAGRLGALGHCGREVCCSTFLKSMASVNMKMLREQGLAMSQNKFLGMCGRLLCCLNYENDTYVEARKYAPKQGERVETPKGPARVKSLNLLAERCLVEYLDESLPREVVAFSELNGGAYGRLALEKSESAKAEVEPDEKTPNAHPKETNQKHHGCGSGSCCGGKGQDRMEKALTAQQQMVSNQTHSSEELPVFLEGSEWVGSFDPQVDPQVDPQADLESKA